jgi:uncharacterized membrane protein affecting hemolysin expression
MRIRDFSIRFKLALLILTASVLAVLLASLGFAIYERHSYRASAVRELTALADTLGANTAASLTFNDQGTAKAMLGALATEPNLLAACLYDNQGSIFAEYRSPGTPRNLILPSRREDGAEFNGDFLTLSRGVLLNGERTGSIALIFDLRDFRARLYQYAKIAALVLLLSVLASFLVSLRLARLIGDPLVQLAAVARRISTDKNYAVRARINSGGETGLLVDSFNEMLSQIESRLFPLRRARSAMRWPLAARTTACGTGTWLPIKFTSPRAGTICWAMRRANIGPDQKSGSAIFMPTTGSGFARKLPRIARTKPRSSSVNIACATNPAAISGH